MKERKIWLLLAALCAVGGLIQLPFQPARFGGVFFLALAIGCAGEWLMLKNREKHRTCRVLAMAGRVLFALFLLSFAYIQIGVIQSGMHADEAAEHSSYLLVLGALVNPDGQPSAALAARCDTAIAFLSEHSDAKAILSGGQGANEPRTEASSMFDYMTARGVAPERLLLEDQATNTIQNIRYAVKISQSDFENQLGPKEAYEGEGDWEKELALGGESIAVVTSDYHLARARRLMRYAAGLTGVGIPAPTPYPGQWVSVRCREYCSILGLMLTGRW